MILHAKFYCQTCEWFTFSGPYAFAVTVGTYLCSKEIYVMEHEFYNGISLFIICVFAVKQFGPKTAEFLDKKIDEFEAQLNESRNQEIAMYEDVIASEKKEQVGLDGQKMIFDIKKENVKIQLEAIYRERLAQVYQEV